MRLIAVFRQIIALSLTLEVSFCNGVDKNYGTREKGQAIARNGVKQKKMLFLPDSTTVLEEIYAGNITTVGQDITAADNFTMHSTKEKLKSFLADDVLYNVTYNNVSSRRINSLKRFVLNTNEDQKDIMSTLNDDLTDLQFKIDDGRLADSTDACKWEENNKKTECLPPGCREAFKITGGGGGGESGVYKIRPPGTNVLAFHVYCLKDDKSGDQPWTIIQRRLDGEEEFNRNWNEYKKGFGSLADEFWLGMDHIYTLTNSDRYELRITLTNWDDEIYVAHYDNFLISDEASNYTLIGIGVSGGNISDSFKIFHSGSSWSTKDRDNDHHKKKHCARYFKSGWWYHRCLLSNLNGAYPIADETFSKTGTAKGIYWGSRQATTYRDSEMAIRIKKFTKS